MKALGCDSADAKQTLLACLKFQHLNDEVPERQNVMIKDGKLRLFAKEQSCCTWMEAVTVNLWDVLGNFETHLSNHKMCRVAGRLAEGNETKAVKGSIWKNPSCLQVFVQDCVSACQNECLKNVLIDVCAL